MSPCPHLRSAFFRHPFGDGRSYHLAEHCLDCGVNVRGAGVWVPRQELLETQHLNDPGQLPVWDAAGSRVDGPSLFDIAEAAEGE
jgi:hypothetical protein